MEITCSGSFELWICQFLVFAHTLHKGRFLVDYSVRVNALITYQAHEIPTFSVDEMIVPSLVLLLFQKLWRYMQFQIKWWHKEDLF